MVFLFSPHIWPTIPGINEDKQGHDLYNLADESYIQKLYLI